MLTVLVCLALALVSGRAAQGTREPARAREPGQGAVVLPRAAGAGLVLGVHGRHRHPGDRAARARADSVPRPRDRRAPGEWFGGPGGWPLVLRSALFGLRAVLAVEAFAIHFGWIRQWWPAASRRSSSPRSIRARCSRLLYALYSIVAGAAVRLDAGRCARAVHLLPVRIRGADRHRHPLPRAELGVLLVARAVAGALSHEHEEQASCCSLSSLASAGCCSWPRRTRKTSCEEWRRIQRATRHASAAGRGADSTCSCGRSSYPALRAADRCVSVPRRHGAGRAGRRRRSGSAPKHPDVVHDPAEFGCTSATAGRDAPPRRPTRTATVAVLAGADDPGELRVCGLRQVPHAPGGARTWRSSSAGARAVRTQRLPGLPRLDGRGGTLRPGGPGHGRPGPLARRRQAATTPTGTTKHLAQRAGGRRPGPWRSVVRRRSATARPPTRSTVFLSSRVGAPGLVEAKALFHSLGCRGCHKVGGVGGDDGPDLTRAGRGTRPARLLARSGRADARELARGALPRARRVVPGSPMPALGLDRAARSTRWRSTCCRCAAATLPEASCRMTVSCAERFGEREFATDGATLYGAFCAACHGPARRRRCAIPGMAAFPAIGNPDFLAVASDEFLARDRAHGRPGGACRPGARSERRPAPGGDRGGRRAICARSGSGVSQPRHEPPRWVQRRRGGGRRAVRRRLRRLPRRAGRGQGRPGAAQRRAARERTDTISSRRSRRGRRGTVDAGVRAGLDRRTGAVASRDRVDRRLRPHLGGEDDEQRQRLDAERVPPDGRRGRLRRVRGLGHAGRGGSKRSTTRSPRYPDRDWEKVYRDLWEYDSKFTFLCAPNDTHNCLLNAYVRSGVMTRIGPDDALRRGHRPGRQRRHRTAGTRASARRGWRSRAASTATGACATAWCAPASRSGSRRAFRAATTAGLPPSTSSRGRDEWVRVTHDEAARLVAAALVNIAETYTGERGREAAARRSTTTRR